MNVPSPEEYEAFAARFRDHMTAFVPEVKDFRMCSYASVQKYLEAADTLYNCQPIYTPVEYNVTGPLWRMHVVRNRRAFGLCQTANRVVCPDRLHELVACHASAAPRGRLLDPRLYGMRPGVTGTAMPSLSAPNRLEHAYHFYKCVRPNVVRRILAEMTRFLRDEDAADPVVRLLSTTLSRIQPPRPVHRIVTFVED